MNFMDSIRLIVVVYGIYLVTISMWELREGTNRKKFVLFMFSGLILLFVIPSFLY